MSTLHKPCRICPLSHCHMLSIRSFILDGGLQPLPAKMSKENESKRSSVRISHSLNEPEKDHVTSRRVSVLQCLLQHDIQCSLSLQDEVPNIALLGSGGGERAMLGLLGSLVQLDKEGLLDIMLYLGGVSGSTWCMASLYKEPDWSSNLEKVKDDIIQRLVGAEISFRDKLSTLKKYSQKDNFSLTDIWSALVISKIVKEIDEHAVTDQRSQHSKDPYPIYSVIDKQSCRDKLKADIFFEITPHEAGYSLTGAFVDSSCFGCQFDQGCKINDQPAMDMLYLQGLCGSVFADIINILEHLSSEIKKLFCHESDVMCYHAPSGKEQTDHLLSSAQVDEVCQGLLTLVELNLLVLREEDPSSHIEILYDLLRGKLNEEEYEKLIMLDMMSDGMAKKNIEKHTLYVCKLYTDWFQHQNYNSTWTVIVKCIELVTLWIWGTTYNFLYNMTEDISPHILKKETRHYEDAGIFINSPFFSVLRKERHIDLIISLDFSDDDPFETVVKTAETCKELHIPFPKVQVSEEDKRAPKDFYVFEGHSNAPSVIHIPLFNTINCGGDIKKWKERYTTFQRSYSCLMISDLMEKAEMNIKNNKVGLLREIQKVINKRSTNQTLD
ncbi:cytosolic phospholipase A2 gamma isoform X2 [Myxocyprinus asiaticus]|uniref:cytosolic phospholipase A2 gamma isoform X2 n=1 Tax=Myxocyprinus asiaticus TaxID=70543 RepID=UPI0022226234|nr:cytosolic phospholipase A2 gamma isoform X2 [Myxocyprinus asiaticus]